LDVVAEKNMEKKKLLAKPVFDSSIQGFDRGNVGDRGGRSAFYVTHRAHSKVAKLQQFLPHDSLIIKTRL